MKIPMTKIRVNGGCKLPFGYGFCYRDYRSDRLVAYLIPFNIIIRYARIIYFKYLTSYKQSKYDKELVRAHLYDFQNKMRGEIDRQIAISDEMRGKKSK